MGSVPKLTRVFLLLLLGLFATFFLTAATPASASGLSGAFIELEAKPMRAGLWTRVQWQDALGNWHAVAGWQGAFNPDQRVLWYVGAEHLGKGPFRWLVYEGETGGLLATSDPFDLPSHPGDVLRVPVSLPTQEVIFDQGDGGKFDALSRGRTACGAPSAPDQNLLLLMSFENAYTGRQGEVASATGTTFVEGKFGQGVLFDDSDQMTVETADNLNLAQGSVSFWLRPNWDGNDEAGYVFFEVGDDWFNRLRIMKDEANNLRFMTWDANAEYDVSTNVAQWRAGEWHHVAVSWQGTQLALFVDCVEMDRTASANLPEQLAATINLGFSAVDPLWADAVIDELQIKAVPFFGLYNNLAIDSLPGLTKAPFLQTCVRQALIFSSA